jgi:hypothetical protein
VLALVQMARRRILHNHLLCEGSNAASAALFAFILLLVFGTQALNWYWVVLLPAGAIAVAAWRVRKRMPSLYVTAQRVDGRMGLADALSTAVFFNHETFTGNETSGSRVSAELCQFQLADAERVATGVDVRQAAPYAFPRTAYAAAALLLVASSVFALRYGLTDRLDLKQPLARILQQRLGYGEPDKQARLDPRQSQKQLPGDDPLATEEGQPNEPAELDQQPGDAAENYSDQSKQSAAKADAKSKNDQSEADANEDGQADQSEQPADGQQNANPKDGQKQGKDSQTGSPNSQNNQSLMSKMKDAMQNLLNSLQQNPREQQQSANNQNGKGNKGQQNQNKQQSKGEKSKSQSGDSQDQQAAEDSQEAQNSQGQSAEQQDSLANKQPGSGAGNRDGAKDVRQAEQLAAMGKISEIIGKRAANVTGEATVDVQNTSQQLRTSYQDRRSEHAQTGAEINRDEIPVALESYVEQYFEQVRKQAPKQ